MKSFSKLFILGALCVSLFACVTTREQLNAEKGIGVETDESVGNPSSASVKSEDISSPKNTDQPSVVKKPVNSENHPATAPSTNGAPSVVTAQNQATGKPVVIPEPDVSSYSADELRSEVARLSGKVEEVEHDKQTSEQSHLEEKKKNEERIAELEKKLKELQPEAPTVPEGESPFQAGKDAYANGKCDEAINFFSQVLTKSEAGKEAEEATYLRGECYFKKTQYNKAIVDFSHFPEKYQKSSYHPKALLRIAESFAAMGRKDDAKAFYSDLVDKFPKTAEGKLAKKRLKAKK